MMPAVLTEDLAAVLRTVALADFCEPSTIAKAMGQGVAEQLDQLCTARLVMRNAARRADRTRTTLYTITANGREQLRAHEINQVPRLRVSSGVPTVAAPRTAQMTSRGTYMGAELRPFDGRPGAMDAFALPSRMGRRLHYRDGTVRAHTTDTMHAVVGVDVQDGALELGPVTLMHESPQCAHHANVGSSKGFITPPAEGKA